MAEANVRGEYEQEYEAPFAIAIRYLSVPRRRVQSPTPTGRGGFQSPIRTPPNPGRGDGRGPNGPPTDCRKEPIVYLTLDTDTCPAWTPALPGEFEKIYRIFPFTNPGVKRPRI
jgi:hypothetical protein